MTLIVIKRQDRIKFSTDRSIKNRICRQRTCGVYALLTTLLNSRGNFIDFLTPQHSALATMWVQRCHRDSWFSNTPVPEALVGEGKFFFNDGRLHIGNGFGQRLVRGQVRHFKAPGHQHGGGQTGTGHARQDLLVTDVTNVTGGMHCFLVDGTGNNTLDLTGQANHLGVTIGADIIKQKLPETNGGYGAVTRALGQSYGMTDERIYNELASSNPIDLCRYQVLNCYAGRIGLINSGGAAGQNDVHDAVRTAVINKRAGGCGLIMGRKAFQKPRQEGAELIQLVQDVYLDPAIPIA